MTNASLSPAIDNEYLIKKISVPSTPYQCHWQPAVILSDHSAILMLAYIQLTGFLLQEGV